MLPLTFINGVLFASAAAIALGLAVVSLLFFILGTDHPRLEGEWRTLLLTTSYFLVLTAMCGVSFIGALKQRPWRLAAQAAMWVMLGLLAWYHWPR